MTVSRNTKVLGMALAAVLFLDVDALLADVFGGYPIAATQGSVEVGRGEPPVWSPARSGETLSPGDIIRTGSDGRAEISFPQGRTRLFRDSILRIAPIRGRKGTRAQLARGSAAFDIEPKRTTRFEVVTGEAVLAVKGTRFAVTTRDGDTVAVVETGEVRLFDARNPKAEGMSIRTGFAAAGGKSADFRLHAVEDAGVWNSWQSGGAGPLPSAHLAPSRTDEVRRDARQQIETEVIEEIPASLADWADDDRRFREIREAIGGELGASGSAAGNTRSKKKS